MAWRAPVGEGIVLHKFTRDLDAPKDIRELTERTAAIAQRVIAKRPDSVWFFSATKTTEDVLSLLHRNEKAIAALRQDTLSAIATDRNVDIALHYGGDPVLSFQ